jgi:DNA-binding NtrC family response regulator
MARPIPLPSVHPTDRIIGTSPIIGALRAHIRHLATFDTLGSDLVPTLLVQGETGTGKGLVARVLHDSGPRASGPFVEVNCAAIPETLLETELFGFVAGTFTDAKRAKPGLFETASGGTLFLDEIDTLPLTLQGKLLTAIEAKRVRRVGAVAETPVDVKLTAATQADLSARIAEGRFRADLYYRLAVLLLEIPPLCKRGTDVLVLAHQFLQRYAEGHRLRPKQLSAAAEAWLQRYAWPGNVRELSHLMERVTLLHAGGRIEASTLEELCLPHTPPLPHMTEKSVADDDGFADEPSRIRQALLRTGGNVVQAARLLGWSREALRYRMRRHGIERAPVAPPLPPAPIRPGARLPHPLLGTGAEARPNDERTRSTPEEPSLPRSAWEQKVVAVLAIEMTWPDAAALDAAGYELWTVMTRWDQRITEKVQGFGGMILQRTPSLLLVAFGLPRTLERMDRQAEARYRDLKDRLDGAEGQP